MLSAMSPGTSSNASDSLDSEPNVQELNRKVYSSVKDYQQDSKEDEDGNNEESKSEALEGPQNQTDRSIVADKLAIGQFNERATQRDYLREARSIVSSYQTGSKSSATSMAHSLSRLCDDDGAELMLQQSRDANSALDQCVANAQQARAREHSISNITGASKDFEEVKQVDLFGSSIVALTINGRERLCLAQISNTLLRDFSYNEIHNRRVALGITCVQCTPIQLEMLRRAGAMPSSSRRCGMITRREAERLCRSFLVDEQPPELPENFYFTVAHRVNYGCKGRFVPARYISSRAKCIECFYCGEYYSPNKFIFHSHRQPHATDCNPPDSPNINSWRKHIDLDWTQEHGQDVRYAWEDVKSLFNGGTRRRAPNSSSTASGSPSASCNGGGGGGRSISLPEGHQSKLSLRSGGSKGSMTHSTSRDSNAKLLESDDQLIDVESDDLKIEAPLRGNGLSLELVSGNGNEPVAAASSSVKQADWAQSYDTMGASRSNRNISSIILHNSGATARSSMINTAPGTTKSSASMQQQPQHQIKRMHPSPASSSSKRLMSGQRNPRVIDNEDQQGKIYDATIGQQQVITKSKSPSCLTNSGKPPPLSAGASNPMGNALANLPMEHQRANGGLLMEDLIPADTRAQIPFVGAQNSLVNPAKHLGFTYPMAATAGAAPNFIYNQLYSQLVQPQRVDQSIGSSALDAQLAIRHHLWSSLLANLQCNSGTNDGQHNVM